MRQREFEVSIVSPVYNEEAVLRQFFERVEGVLEGKADFELVFVDDGSRDNSFEVLKQCQSLLPERVKVLRLARNFGHQIAITAGIKEASGRSVVVSDSDLQDPPEVILEFISHWKQGYDIVYGVRTERKGETFFKKVSAFIFYRLMQMVTHFDIPENAGDFYLLDRKVVDVLNTMEERHRFIRGMVAWTGFKKRGVGYARDARPAGRTKFGFWRMLKFSLDAATSFSFLPLRMISVFGTVISFFAFLGILLTVYMRLFTDQTITGWSSLMVTVLFVGGIQLLSIGIIGEYIARIGDDVKHRPLYTITDRIG